MSTLKKVVYFVTVRAMYNRLSVTALYSQMRKRMTGVRINKVCERLKLYLNLRIFFLDYISKFLYFM